MSKICYVRLHPDLAPAYLFLYLYTNLEIKHTSQHEQFLIFEIYENSQLLLLTLRREEFQIPILYINKHL